MRLLSGLTMLLIGALVVVTSLREVEAFGVRKNEIMGEDHQSEMPTTTAANPAKVVNRGKVKFQMPKSLMLAVAAATANTNPVARNRMSRVRTTQAPNSIAGDSVEKDFTVTEEQKLKTTTSKVIWWTSTTPSPIDIDSLEQADDDVSLELTPIQAVKLNPSVVSRVLPVNRFNRFRTTTVSTPVTRDSLEQDDDDKPKAVNKLATTRFSRVRSTTTTAAPNLMVARDSLELDDVSLEVVPVPVLNRGRTATRGQNKFQMTARKVITMNRQNRTQTPVATTVRSSILADSKEVDLSLEDVELTILSTTQAPAATTTEAATTDDVEVTATPSTFIISKLFDDLSTEIDDSMTTQGTTIITTESDDITTSAVPTTISKQSDETDDLLDDIVVLQTTTTVATTTAAPTTAAPVVTRLQSRGRSRMQATTSSAAVPKVNRMRTTTMSPKISSDEQNDSIIMAVLTSTTTSAPVSKNRFSRVRTTTFRAPSVTEESPKVVPAAPTATTMRNNLMGNRFSRFRTTTTTTTAAPVITKAVETEKPAPKRVPAALKKSRFGNVRTQQVLVAGDSGEKEAIVLGDVLKVNKASSNNNVVLVAVESEAVSQLVKTEAVPAVRNPATRGRMGRGRATTTPLPIASRHSGEENVSLEDLVIKINRPTEQMVKTSSDPAVVANVQPMADVSPISRHSDEQVDKVVVPLDGGLMVVVEDVDVSDELPATTTLDPISNESTEKDDLTLVMEDVIVSAVLPEAVVVDLPDISDEIIPVVVATTTTTVNPISMESEELPVVKPMTRRIVNRRKQVTQI